MWLYTVVYADHDEIWCGKVRRGPALTCQIWPISRMWWVQKPQSLKFGKKSGFSTVFRGFSFFLSPFHSLISHSSLPILPLFLSFPCLLFPILIAPSHFFRPFSFPPFVPLPSLQFSLSSLPCFSIILLNFLPLVFPLFNGAVGVGKRMLPVLQRMDDAYVFQLQKSLSFASVWH